MKPLLVFVLILVMATSASSIEKRAYKVRDDFGSEALQQCFLQYYYYVPCPTYSWFSAFHGWDYGDIVGQFFTVGDMSTGSLSPCDPYDCKAVAGIQVLDFAGYGAVYPGLYTVRFDLYCSDEYGCPVGQSLWNSGPVETGTSWNTIMVEPPVSITGCSTDPGPPPSSPRILITATHIGSECDYPEWGADNIGAAVTDGCEMHDVGCLPALYPRPAVSHYSIIHSGYYGPDFAYCPPKWFQDPADTTTDASLYGYVELAWRLLTSCEEGPAAPTACAASDSLIRSVRVTWHDNSSDEDGFKIYRDGVPRWTVGAGVTSFDDTAAVVYQVYQYCVTAYRGGFESGACCDAGCRILGPAPLVSAIEDVPNDQGRQVSISWNRSLYDALGDTVTITGYSLWRRIDDLIGKYRTDYADGRPTLAGVGYPPGDWHYVLTVPAGGENTYACVSPTLCDSTSGGTCWSVFFVRAMTPDPLLHFDSEPDSGYSIDNLAPSAPPGLVMVSATKIAWEEVPDEDFNYFTVYGSDAPSLDSTAVLLGYTVGTQMNVSGDDGYYHVTATDFAGNQGDPSTVENMYAGTGKAEDLPTCCALRQTSPNPFEAITTIAFDIAEDAFVSLKVFDVEGGLVRVLTNREWPGGRHSLTWDGATDTGESVGPGIYFVRMDADRFTATRKVMLVK
jgi:hypothetical protein